MIKKKQILPTLPKAFELNCWAIINCTDITNQLSLVHKLNRYIQNYSELFNLLELGDEIMADVGFP